MKKRTKINPDAIWYEGLVWQYNEEMHPSSHQACLQTMIFNLYFFRLFIQQH